MRPLSNIRVQLTPRLIFIDAVVQANPSLVAGISIPDTVDTYIQLCVAFSIIYLISFNLQFILIFH